MKIAHRDELILLTLGQCGWVGRRLAYAKVIYPAITHMPALVLGSVCRGYVVVLDNHLIGQEVNLVAEIFVFGIVNPEHTAHAHMLEVAQTEVVYPEVLLQEGGEGYAVVLEHI